MRLVPLGRDKREVSSSLLSAMLGHDQQSTQDDHLQKQKQVLTKTQPYWNPHFRITSILTQ